MQLRMISMHTVSYPNEGVCVRCFEIMVSTKKSEEAVSPVIGVILMVAVTVILAAIIAAFVFGMAGNIQGTKNVAFTLQRINTTAVSAACYGGADTTVLTGGVNASVNGVPVGIAWAPGTAPVVGSTRIINTTAANQRVSLIGTFGDGQIQVLVDKVL